VRLSCAYEGGCLLWLSYFHIDEPQAITFGSPTTIGIGDEFKFKTSFETLKKIKNPDEESWQSQIHCGVAYDAYPSILELYVTYNIRTRVENPKVHNFSIRMKTFIC
jgi:hypothetical protein